MAIIAALLLLLGLLAVLFAPDAQPVDLASAAFGDMAVTVSSEGMTRVKENYEITAPVAGRLLRVTLKAGDHVVANKTVVALIEPPPPQFHDVRSQAELEAKTRAAESALAQARAELERTQAQLGFAEADVSRYKGLAAQGAEPRRAMEQYTLEAQTRRSAVEMAQKAVEQKRSELEQIAASLIGPDSAGEAAAGPHRIEVFSPVSGEVLNTQRVSETVIAPGQTIMSVGNPAQIEVMLEMLSEDAVKVHEGASAMLDGWGGTPLHMRVRRIEPFGYTKISALGIEEQRVHVLLDFTDPPEARAALGHGYRVTGKIPIWEGKRVLKLPMGALFRDGARWAVYAVEDGKAHLRHVQIGHLNDTEAEVLAGMAEGDQVVLHPSDRIADGTPVRPRT
ncbi:MAG TPA: HlyD family efflux transporter periplasmic adaptor subunit [Acetobacteraceae bacterium]|nr:HlyD family efflux transporter periplasmic adaptor subunit [Acetobacteraceae bacterium]